MASTFVSSSTSFHSSRLHSSGLLDSSHILRPADHLLHCWHLNRFGHVSVQTIKKMARTGFLNGLSIPSNANLHFCASCVQGKQHREIFPIN